MWNASHIIDTHFFLFGFSWGFIVYPFFFFLADSQVEQFSLMESIHTSHCQAGAQWESEQEDMRDRYMTARVRTFPGMLSCYGQVQLVFKPRLYFHDRKSGSPTWSARPFSLLHIHPVPSTPLHISSISFSGINGYRLTGQRKAA